MKQNTKSAYGRMKRYSWNLSRYYQTPAVQISLSVVLSLFIVTFFILVALRPTFTTIASLKKEVEDSEKTLRQLKTKATAVQQAAQLWEKIKPNLNHIEAGIPSSGLGYQTLTKQLEALATKNGVEITSETIGKGILYSEMAQIYEGRERGITTTELTIRVNGTYPAAMQFLEKLLTAARLVEVESITITKETSTENQPVIALSISGSVQYLANVRASEQILGTKGGGK